MNKMNEKDLYCIKCLKNTNNSANTELKQRKDETNKLYSILNVIAY